MSGAGHRLSEQDARAILGVDLAAGDAVLGRAFRAAVKRAHPDRPGGDDERLRLIIEAYRRLRPAAAVPAARRRRSLRLIVTPVDAVLGGWRPARLSDGRVLHLHLPAGLREGERLSIDGQTVTVNISGDGEAAVLGDHLCLTIEVEPGLLSRGGRLIVDTPAGPLPLWVSGQDAARGFLRAPGRGLPARGRHAQGHLFVRLAPMRAAVPESAAQGKLRRFAAVWAA